MSPFPRTKPTEHDHIWFQQLCALGKLEAKYARWSSTLRLRQCCLWKQCIKPSISLTEEIHHKDIPWFVNARIFATITNIEEKLDETSSLKATTTRPPIFSHHCFVSEDFITDHFCAMKSHFTYILYIFSFMKHTSCIIHFHQVSEGSVSSQNAFQSCNSIHILQEHINHSTSFLNQHSTFREHIIHKGSVVARL